MPASEWISLVACVGILALAALVLQRRSSNPLGLPLGLWALSLFGWNFAQMAYRIRPTTQWLVLDLSLSPWTAPLAFHSILTFVGRQARHRRLLTVSYLVFGGLSLWAPVTALYSAGTAAPPQSLWSLIYVACWIPLLALSLVLLVRHLRATSRAVEQVRTRLFIAALLAGGALGITELQNDVVDLPSLGVLGSLASAAIVSTVVLRFRLLGSELSSTVALYALSLAVLGLLAYLVVLHYLGQSTALVLLGSVGVTAALAAASWDAARSARRSWGRMRGLALVGRFSAQLAHDIKNPLAALHGALQYLDREREAAPLPAGQARMLELIADQVERLRKVADKYQRLSRLEPTLERVALNDLVQRARSAASLATAERPALEIRVELGEDLPACDADPDLLLGAVENVISNAVDSMPNGGIITLRTARSHMDHSVPSVVVAVVDSGEGMDAREQLRAFDDFFSGKGSSGLGLAFVRTVIEAHGGEVRLASTLGKGTTVELHLPVGPPPSRADGPERVPLGETDEI